MGRKVIITGPSLMGLQQLVQEDVLTTSYSIFGFELFQNVPLAISKFLNKCIFTYVGFDAIRGHPRKFVHERRSLSRMRASIQRALNPISMAVERDSSLLELWIELSRCDSSLQLNRFSLNGRVRRSLEERNYRPSDIAFLIVCDFYWSGDCIHAVSNDDKSACNV